jgi:hypothetical protein
MPLDLNKLEKRAELTAGIIQARCPACAEMGTDKKGEHLRIYPDGRFGCCVFPGDRDHRRRIFVLAGEHAPQPIKTRVAAPKSTGAAQSGIIERLGRLFPSSATNPASPGTMNRSEGIEVRSREARTFGMGPKKAGCSSAAELELSLGEVGTLGTPSEDPRVYPDAAFSVVGEDTSASKESCGGVPGVPKGEATERMPDPSGKKSHMPHFTLRGTLVIPFDSPERYHWWKGGCSVKQTMAELQAK